MPSSGLAKVSRRRMLLHLSEQFAPTPDPMDSEFAPVNVVDNWINGIRDVIHLAQENRLSCIEIKIDHDKLTGNTRLSMDATLDGEFRFNTSLNSKEGT